MKWGQASPPFLCLLCLSAAVQINQHSQNVLGSYNTTKKHSYYWSRKNGDELRSGASLYTVQNELEAGPTWSWQEPKNGLVRAGALIDDELNIYLATIRGNIYKFNPAGKQLWKFVDGSNIPDVPVLWEGSLFATNSNGFIFALNMKTGRQMWRKRMAMQTQTDTWSMTAGNGIVVAAVSSGGKANDKIVGLNAKTGKPVWRYVPSVPVYNFLGVIKDGSLVFSDLTGAPHRLNLADGKLIWKAGPAGPWWKIPREFSTGGGVIGPNGVLYISSNAGDGSGKKKGHVSAFSFTDGRLLWRRFMWLEANSVPAVGRLMADSKSRLAVVVGVGENPDMPEMSMMLLKKKPNTKKIGRVLALDARTGAELWRYSMPEWYGWAAGEAFPSHICLPESFGAPAIGGDGTVYIGFMNGNFLAIRDIDGNHHIDAGKGEASIFEFGHAIAGSPAIAPGLLVITTCNGMHVFRTNTSKTSFQTAPKAQTHLTLTLPAVEQPLLQAKAMPDPASWLKQMFNQFMQTSHDKSTPEAKSTPQFQKRAPPGPKLKLIAQTTPFPELMPIIDTDEVVPERALPQPQGKLISHTAPVPQLMPVIDTEKVVAEEDQLVPTSRAEKMMMNAVKPVMPIPEPQVVPTPDDEPEDDEPADDTLPQAQPEPQRELVAEVPPRAEQVFETESADKTMLQANPVDDAMAQAIPMPQVKSMDADGLQGEPIVDAESLDEGDPNTEPVVGAELQAVPENQLQDDPIVQAESLDEGDPNTEPVVGAELQAVPETQVSPTAEVLPQTKLVEEEMPQTMPIPQAEVIPDPIVEGLPQTQAIAEEIPQAMPMPQTEPIAEIMPQSESMEEDPIPQAEPITQDPMPQAEPITQDMADDQAMPISLDTSVT